MEYDNTYMKREDLDYLADMISINIIRYMETLDQFAPITKEEELLGELARLMTLLSSYEESSEYEKCAIIKNKIKRIQKKLDNL